MPKWLLRAICVAILLCVGWVVVHPQLELEPTAFRFAVFAAITLFLLRSAYRFAREIVLPPAKFVSTGPQTGNSGGLSDRPPLAAPLRC